VFIDEFSRIEEGYQLLAGTADTTRCRIFNFTPYGTSNAAYKLARRNDVRKLRLHWSEHPEKARGLYKYNSQTSKVEVLDKQHFHGAEFEFVKDGKLRSPWYDGECARRANEREVAQMLDIDYQGSAYQFFDKPSIVRLQNAYAVPAYWEGDLSFDPDTGRFLGLMKQEGGPLKLWCHPGAEGRVKPQKCGMGGDLSQGTGTTNSCLSVVACSTGDKLAAYVSPFLRPAQMALRAVALGWMFKNLEGQPAAFAWEMQGPGVVFGQRVIELGYRNVYYRRQEKAIGKPYVGKQMIPGWTPTPDNKLQVLSEYRSALAAGQFTNRDWEALEECLAFVFTAQGRVEYARDASESDTFDPTTGKDPTGAAVNHGDRVIADALAWMMAKGRFVAEKKAESKEPPLLSMAWRRQYARQRQRESDRADY
jgi:hypothetical protein